MSKRIFTAAAAALLASAASAYNPPVGGEALDRLSSPTQLTSGASAAGGGLFTAGPDSIAFNPALIGAEQRVTLDLGYSALVSFDDTGHPFGSAFQTGILIPSKWMVGAGTLKGVFAPSDEMYDANNMTVAAAISKEVAAHLQVGLGINGGVFWGEGTDWLLSANVGALYRRPKLGKVSDFRVGVSLLNLGKTYTGTDLPGFDDRHVAGAFPFFATLKVGAALNVFDAKGLRGGVSLDVTLPGFQNVILDATFQMSIKEAVIVRVAEEVNFRECFEGHASVAPAVSVGYKFKLNAQKSGYMKSKGWERSDMTVSLGWQNLYQTLNAFSAGAVLQLGSKDEDPPKITLWNGEGGK